MTINSRMLFDDFKAIGYAAKLVEKETGSRQEGLQLGVKMARLVLRPDLNPALGNLLPTLPGMCLVWCEQGFPAVELGHRLAASFMCTSFTAEMFQQTHAPWECFQITIPEGVLQSRVECLVFSGPRGIAALVIADDYFQVLVAEDLFGCTTTGGEHVEVLDGGEITDATRLMVERQTKLIGRVIGGVCCEMDKPKTRQQIALGRPAKKNRKNDPREAPTSWVFKVARPTKVDLREYVRSYVSGNRGGSLNVQHLVRGHWKHQACGPNLAERKWIHIEPYWRGDENAPIALRSHHIDAPA